MQCFWTTELCSPLHNTVVQRCRIIGQVDSTTTSTTSHRETSLLAACESELLLVWNTTINKSKQTRLQLHANSPFVAALIRWEAKSAAGRRHLDSPGVWQPKDPQRVRVITPREPLTNETVRAVWCGGGGKKIGRRREESRSPLRDCDGGERERSRVRHVMPHCYMYIRAVFSKKKKVVIGPGAEWALMDELRGDSSH